MLRIEGRVFFLNCQRIVDKIWHEIGEAKPSVLVLDARSLIDIEYTALRMLTETEEELRSQGITLWLAELNPHALTVVQQSALGERLGRERMFMSLHSAVRDFESTR